MHSGGDVRALISPGDWRMDVCQTHLTLPWIKSVGGRGRVSCFRFHAAFAGISESACSRIPAWGEWLRRAAEERRGLDFEPNRGTRSVSSALFLRVSRTVGDHRSESRVGLWP